jgi:hypothetical protein
MPSNFKKVLVRAKKYTCEKVINEKKKCKNEAAEGYCYFFLFFFARKGVKGALSNFCVDKEISELIPSAKQKSGGIYKIRPRNPLV